MKAILHAGWWSCGLLLAGCHSPRAADPPTAVAANSPVPRQYSVRLAPTDVDRAAQVIHFKLPNLPPRAAFLRDSANHLAPLQIEPGGSAVFFVPFQKAGETLVFTTALLAPNPATDTVQAAAETGRLALTIEGQPAFDYQMDLAKPPRDDIPDKILRGAFLYPIFTPHGVQISDTYPVDHPHDHGIWTAWTETEFQGRKPDFWNPHYPNGGTVEFVALDNSWNGTVDAGFQSRHRFIDRTATPPIAALNESWTVTLYAAGGVPARIFDLDLTQTVATADPLVLLQYRYGGLGVRGHLQWLDKSNLTVLTSEGITDRVQADAKPARWFFMGGKIDNAPAGIAVLDHPSNFRAPQPVRMNPDQPFFMYAAVISGGFSISKDEPYRARYRFIVQDGPPDSKFLEACWQGYAHPAEVTVELK